MNIKLIIPIIVLTLCLTNVSGQERALINKRDKAEKQTKRFDPLYWQQSENKHLAFFLKIAQDSSIETAGVEARVGKMPHRSKSGGEVKVTYRDNGNTVLGSYYTSDPLVVRSCDNQGTHVQPLLVGTVIEILTPYLPNVHTIELEHVYKKSSRTYIVGPGLENLRLTVQ